MPKHRSAAAAGLFLFGVFVSAMAYAQEAFTIPRSNRVVFGELTFPDKTTARFVVRDGTWVTVEDRKAKFFYAFNGIINDQTGNPNFVPYELIRLTPDDTSVNELDKSKAYTSADQADPKRDIPIGKEAKFTSASNIRLRVTGVGEWTFAAPYISDISQYSDQELEEEFGVSGNGACCITCQSRTICAGSVSTSCGDCDGGGGGALVY